MANRLLIHWT